jgi:dTDP-glucose 4,6-dehydratase
MDLILQKLHSVYIEDFQSLAQREDMERFRGTAWLVTGATGFVPAYLVRFLCWLNVQHGLGVRLKLWVRSRKKALQLFPWAEETSGWLGIEEVDWDRPDDWQPVECDYLVHAASPASPAACAADPQGVVQCNTTATQALLERAGRPRLKGFLFLSSSEVYGDTAGNEWPGEEETGVLDPASPRSLYPLAKRQGEALCHEADRSSGIPVRIARIFHTYGPGMDLQADGRVFADFVGNAVRGEDILLKSDGSGRRAFCYIADTVSGLLRMLGHEEGALTCNVGNPGAVLSVSELADLLIGLVPEKKLKKVVMDTKSAQSASSSVFPATDRLRSLGWVPMVPAAEGFARTIHSYNP